MELIIMCIIIYLPRNKKISRSDLRDAWNYNPDGGGLAYLKNGKVNVLKGFLKFDDFIDACGDIINDTSLERVIHFRFTSRGETNRGQTHPFPLSKSKKDLNKIAYSTTTPVLFHNGTLSCKVEDGFNDTQTWIKQSLYKYKNDLSFLLKILNVNSSRWVIVSPNKVTVTDDFINENGIYYSNLYWRNNYYIYSNGKKSNYSIKKSATKKSSRKSLKDTYSDSSNFYWLVDPNHDYESDEGCSHCYWFGYKCERCFLNDEKYEDEGSDYTYTYDYRTDDVTVYEIVSDEAK